MGGRYYIDIVPEYSKLVGLNTIFNNSSIESEKVMKIIINTCFGGFSINKDIAEQYGFSQYDESRTNEKLIKLIESGINCNGECAKLKVVDIPDDATDYYIDEYDGVENVLYVMNGKIHML